MKRLGNYRLLCVTPARLAAAVAFLLCLAGGGLAADAERLKSAQRAFATLDADGDQLVTFEEFASKKILAFSAPDRNRDNYLSSDELRITPEQFGSLDRDGDGKISGVEFVDSPYGQFEAYDSDKNGTITFEEFSDTLIGT
ncbi:MAG TPA: hypothetical protein VED46_06795 [Alphaproteobacteria bacterium]|nr:hypothetical protein [Alphaproteobacteria bacterium]